MATAAQPPVSDLRALRSETRGFLDVLDRRVTHLRASALNFSNPKHTPSYTGYSAFRKEVSSCIGFATIIEDRLEILGDKIERVVVENYDRLIIDVWIALLDGAMRYLTAIDSKKELAFGSRGLYEQELKTLSTARASLEDERFEDLVPAQVLDNLKAAEELLDSILQRAPDLQEFLDDPEPIEDEDAYY